MFATFSTLQIPVPRQAVGIVIGKGGEMIKKIQSETGARVQFKPGKKLFTFHDIRYRVKLQGESSVWRQTS